MVDCLIVFGWLLLVVACLIVLRISLVIDVGYIVIYLMLLFVWGFGYCAVMFVCCLFS